jgi:hypothetical protein
MRVSCNFCEPLARSRAGRTGFGYLATVSNCEAVLKITLAKGANECNWGDS